MTTHWIFGPAELPDKRGYKVSFEKLNSLKYRALQISMANETTLDMEKAEEIAELNEKYDVALSVHAPYHCFITHSDSDQRQMALQALVKCAHMVRTMGGSFVVFHPGLSQGRERDKLMEVVEDNLFRLEDMMADEEIEGISFHVENVSRHDEFGQYDDILEIATLSELVLPCIDWAHIHATSFGGLVKPANFAEVVTKAIDALGEEQACQASWHYADTEHRDGIERQHLEYGEGDPLLRHIVKAVEDAGLERCLMISECPGEPSHQKIFNHMKKVSTNGRFD
jgi:deoxyribonuclease-4